MARHLGISDEEADQAVVLAVARRLILTDGSDPSHSVALFRGLRESDEYQLAGNAATEPCKQPSHGS